MTPAPAAAQVDNPLACVLCGEFDFRPAFVNGKRLCRVCVQQAASQLRIDGKTMFPASHDRAQP